MTVTLSVTQRRQGLYQEAQLHAVLWGGYDSTLMGSNRGEVGPPRGHAQLGHAPGSLPKGSGRSFSA